MKNLYIILILILGISGSTIPHPNGLVIPEADSTSNCSYYSLDLIAGYNGICFGNSEYCNGFRINFSDCGVKRVSGLNCTFWKGYSNTLQDFTVYGISFGVFPTAGTMKGITIGLAGVQAFHEMDGINLTCMALVGQKANLKGLNFGGMAIVSNEGNITGVNLAGLALISTKGNISGINLGGVGLISEGGHLTGLNVSGIAMISSKGLITGCNFGGVSIIASEGSVTGTNVTLGEITAKTAITGINIAGYKIESNKITGLSIVPGWIEANQVTGVAITGYCKVNGRQTGLSIALINEAEELNGIQIGLINIAGNNGALSWLPILNAHFGI